MLTILDSSTRALSAERVADAHAYSVPVSLSSQPTGRVFLFLDSFALKYPDVGSLSVVNKKMSRAVGLLLLSGALRVQRYSMMSSRAGSFFAASTFGEEFSLSFPLACPCSVALRVENAR